MIVSRLRKLGNIEVPELNIERPMMPFDLKSLDGLCDEFKSVVESMVKHLKIREGMAFLTVHGKQLKASDTLRRGGAHIDGNYVIGERFKSHGGGGWKLGQSGPYLSTQEHRDSYENNNGGIIMASNYPACKAYEGVFNGSPNRGGDCTHIELSGGVMLKANTVYYGNNRMVHESLEVGEDTQRTFIRVTPFN